MAVFITGDRLFYWLVLVDDDDDDDPRKTQENTLCFSNIK